MKDAIKVYHDLLASDQLAHDSQAMLDDQLRRRGLVFGDRPLCTVLRPRLVTAAQLHLLQTRVRPLMRAFRRAYDAAMADATFRKQFGLTDWEEAMLAPDPGYRDPSPTSRIDAFVIDETGDMALTEYNAETPAGAGYSDALADAFIDLPVMRRFSRRYSVRPLPARHGVLNVLLDSYQQWSGKRDMPRIAIVDWADVPTKSEFEVYRVYFESRGIPCVIVTPQSADFHDGKLYFDGQPIDLIYKRVLLHELIAEGGTDHPIVRAVKDGAVCMVNGFRSKILHKKASLAALSDERNAHLFDAEALAAVHAHIPWTRVVEERRTTHNGKELDLVTFMRDNRDRLVLKPNDDYGGAGIVLGWTVDSTAWEDGMKKALESPYIVQERIRIPHEPYPSVVDGTLHVIDRMLDTAPFICFGDYVEGFLTRLSTAALLNVTAGGGSTVPSFLAERR